MGIMIQIEKRKSTFLSLGVLGESQPKAGRKLVADTLLVPHDHGLDDLIMLPQGPESVSVDTEVGHDVDVLAHQKPPRVAVLPELLPVDVGVLGVVRFVAESVVSVGVAVGAEGSVLVDADLAHSFLDLREDLAREHQLPLLHRRVPVAFEVESRANNHNRNHDTIRKKKINYLFIMGMRSCLLF